MAAQRGFMGLVNAIQNGQRPINSVGPNVAAAAHRISPRDPSEVRKKKEPPSDKPNAEKKASIHYKLAMLLPDMVKAAGIESALNSTRRAVQNVSAARQKAVQHDSDQVRKMNADLHQKLVDAQKELVQVTHDAANTAQAASDVANQQQPAPPTPPPAQPAYGAMLTGQPDPNQEQAAK